MSDALRHALSVDSSLSIEVRVSRGGGSVSGSFLILDGGETWLLAASLKDLATRSVLAMQLPYQGNVRSDLEREWEEALGLDAWLREQSQETGSL